MENRTQIRRKNQRERNMVCDIRSEYCAFDDFDARNTHTYSNEGKGKNKNSFHTNWTFRIIDKYETRHESPAPSAASNNAVHAIQIYFVHLNSGCVFRAVRHTMWSIVLIRAFAPVYCLVVIEHTAEQCPQTIKTQQKIHFTEMLRHLCVCRMPISKIINKFSNRFSFYSFMAFKRIRYKRIQRNKNIRATYSTIIFNKISISNETSEKMKEKMNKDTMK